MPLKFEALLGATVGFRDAMVASLPCREGSFGCLFLGTSFEDCAGDGEGLVAALEAFRRPAFDGRGVALGVAFGVAFDVAFDALLFFFGPNFGGFLS